MVRKNFWLTNSQFRFLRKLEGNVSEHIRRAIDKYISELKIERLDVSKSPSSRYATKDSPSNLLKVNK